MFERLLKLLKNFEWKLLILSSVTHVGTMFASPEDCWSSHSITGDSYQLSTNHTLRTFPSRCVVERCVSSNFVSAGRLIVHLWETCNSNSSLHVTALLLFRFFLSWRVVLSDHHVKVTLSFFSCFAQNKCTIVSF
jgi:hypothetical protein